MYKNLSLWLLVALLTACQPIAPTPHRPSPSPAAQTLAAPLETATAPAPTATPPAHLQIDAQQLQGVKIRFWHPYSGDARRVVEQLVDEFNQSNEWGVHVIGVATGGSGVLFERILQPLPDDLPPQLVLAPLDHALAWQQAGREIVNVEEYIHSAEWGLSPGELDDIPPDLWQQDAVNGQRPGIAAQRQPRLLFYNQSWAQELGFDHPPATPLEFKQQACAAAKALKLDANVANDGLGGWIFDNEPLTVLSWLLAFGAEPFPVDAEGRYQFAGPPANEALTYLRSMLDQNCAWLARQPLPYDYFARREALFYSGTLADLKSQQRAMQRQQSGDAWTVLAFPGRDREPIVLVDDLDYILFKAQPSEQLVSWLFLRWMLHPARQARLSEATGAYPPGTTSLDSLSGYRQKYPQWEAALAWRTTARSQPRLASWRQVRQLLQDAVWQVRQPNTPVEQIPDILRQLDATIPEILSHKP